MSSILYRKQEHKRARSEFSDAMSDLARAQENAYNANINDINTWINTISKLTETCDIDIADIANISTRITELSKTISSNRHALGDTLTDKFYTQIEQAESNLMDTISEINAKCILGKRF